MKEKSVHSPVGRGLEIIKDTLFLSPRSTKKLGSSKYDFPSEESAAFEDRELEDVCSLMEDDSMVDIVKASEASKPFAGFGSYRQRHGDVFGCISRLGTRTTRLGSGGGGLSSEAPAKLGTGMGRRGSLSQKTLEADDIERKKEASSPKILRADSSSCPIDINKDRPIFVENKVHRRLQKHRSFSSDIDRDEAWERKRDLYLTDEFGDVHEKRSRAVGRSVSDCGDRTWPRPLAKSRSRTRTRSLTDEDLEELRGCIDLGFGFSYDKSCDLKSTLPALELYCAINRQYNDIKSRSSPVSPLDGVMLDRTSSGGSPGSPLSETWRISSPGDDPVQVKMRLRHWAQAVACSVKQGF